MKHSATTSKLKRFIVLAASLAVFAQAAEARSLPGNGKSASTSITILDNFPNLCGGGNLEQAFQDHAPNPLTDIQQQVLDFSREYPGKIRLQFQDGVKPGYAWVGYFVNDRSILNSNALEIANNADALVRSGHAKNMGSGLIPALPDPISGFKKALE